MPRPRNARNTLTREFREAMELYLRRKSLKTGNPHRHPVDFLLEVVEDPDQDTPTRISVAQFLLEKLHPTERVTMGAVRHALGADGSQQLTLGWREESGAAPEPTTVQGEPA